MEQIKVERVCNMASAIRAASWPEVGAVQAVIVALKFVLVIEDIRYLSEVLGASEERMLH